MTKKQVDYLKLLGYCNTQEEGAMLEHSFIDTFVWKGEIFQNVLSSYSAILEGHIRNNIARKVLGLK